MRLLSALCITILLSAQALLAAKPEHVRVVWRGDAATSAIVSWTTREAGESHTLEYRADGDDAWRKISCHRNGAFARSEGAYFHHARLTGLTPATKHEVIATSDGDATPTRWFLTAPADDRPVQLLYGGDSRSGREHRRKMNDLVKRLAAEAPRQGRPPVLALAHGGDFVNRGSSIEQWLAWLEDYQLTTGDDGRLLPIIPTRGNHDFGAPFNQLFDFPTGDANYYTTHLTPTIRLVTLNTETATAGDQQAWLATELATQPPTRWLLCQYHKPAFPAVKVPSGALMNWVPLFEKHDVDLVLEADGHCIKRTPPIRGMKRDPTGVVYVGEGGLGVGQRTPKPGRWWLQPPAVTGQGHHVHVLTFDADRLVGRVIKEDGSVFDEFMLKPRDREAKPNENDTP